jgi:hypothetical protein
VTQAPKPGRIQEISAPDASYIQLLGALASAIASIASIISGVIMILPSIASMMFERVVLTTNKIP